jgi:hypothetical protein
MGLVESRIINGSIERTPIALINRPNKRFLLFYNSKQAIVLGKY